MIYDTDELSNPKAMYILRLAKSLAGCLVSTSAKQPFATLQVKHSVGPLLRLELNDTRYVICCMTETRHPLPILPVQMFNNTQWI